MNPFFAPSELPYQLPPFQQIQVSHYREAIEKGMADQLAEVTAITESDQPPTFQNTIEALERSGRLLNRVSRVFSNQTSADTNPELQQIEREYAPRFSAHSDALLLNRRLFARIDQLWSDREALDLNAEQLRVLERYHLDYVRAGAALDAEEQHRLRELNSALATLSTEFGARLLADTNDSAVSVTDLDELDGLSEDAVAAAREAALSRGLEGYLLTLVLPTHQPALEVLRNRKVRQRLLEASVTRGRRGNAYDTRQLVRQIVALRADRAELLGYPTHADYILADRTAESNETLDALLEQLFAPAVRNAREEERALAEAMAADGDTAEFAAWDWAYYAQRVKRERYCFDTNTLKPYFEVDRTLLHGVFYAAEQLYGITFTPRPDLVAYHPDARVFEVREPGSGDHGSGLGLFIADYFTRDSKRGGAWMNSLVSQSGLLGQQSVVVNNMNIPKPPEGQPALMTLDEVGTMFHEFGHALHGLLSEVTYPRVSGTAVARDFVEYPSQVNEMWMTWPQVLSNYARHIDTQEVLPAELLSRIEEASTFNQGFETVAYLGATVIDLAWHRLTRDQVAALDEDLSTFEAEVLRRVGLDLPTVPPRYRSSYFNHIFAGAYSAGYYSYIWSEVLDADTVEWFRETGGLSRERGETFRRALLSRGGSASEMSYFADFRGRGPDIGPLLHRRGLSEGSEGQPGSVVRHESGEGDVY
jgi:peptidyl-dipeptidase Dcp